MTVVKTDSPQTPLGEAMLLEHKGKYDDAIAKYEQIVQSNPQSPDAYAGLTRCHLKQDDVDEALETITKAKEVANAWPVQVALGEVYFRQGKIGEAEKEWIEVINAGHPNAARAYLGLARVRRAIAMYKSAKMMIDKAHAIDTNDRDIQRFWIETRSRAERIKYYEDNLANNPDAEERGRWESYLAYLKERAKQPSRPCRLVSKVTNTTTPLVRLLTDPKHMRGYGLSVDLNGTRTKIMLDTGASGILIKSQTAERAGIDKITATKVWGVGDKGPKNGYVGTAKSIRIGELEFQDCPVRVMEDRSVAGEDGLIGADVFQNFLIELDFPGETLKLSELPKRPGEAEQSLALKNEEGDTEQANAPDSAHDATQASPKKETAATSTGPQDRYIAPEMKSFTPVYRFGHQLLVPTKIGEDSPKLFLLDTGAVQSVISLQAAREITKVHGDPHMKVKGLSGSVKDVYSANKAMLQFGHLRQENQDMLSFDTTSISKGNGTEVSGFLGFVVLRMLDIKIDYRDALVDFSYDPQRPH